jgi:alpha-1,2-glucosyltransferase
MDQDRSSSLVAMSTLAYGALLLGCLALFSSAPAYMDEIFHVPQGAAYCGLRFGYYHPAITTFPGLYYLSALLYNTVGRIMRIAPDLKFLRLGNVLLGSALPELIKTTRNVVGTGNTGMLESLVLATFPVGFFFNFLYYTDTASTFFVLAAYALQTCVSTRISKEFSLRLRIGVFLVSATDKFFFFIACLTT